MDHIQEVLSKILKSTVIYKGKKRQTIVEHTYVFENPYTQKSYDHPDMTRTFKELMVKLKLNPDYTPHSIRHGFISYLIKQGESIFNIAKIVGQSTTEITEFVYGHHSTDDLRNTISMIRSK